MLRSHIKVGWVVRSAALLAVLSSLLSGCSRPDTAAIWPDYSAEASTTYEISNLAQTNQAVIISGEQGVSDSLAARFTVRVLESLDGGGAEVEVRLERLVHKTRGASELPVDFDSDRADASNTPEVFLGVYRAAMSARVGLTLSADGRASGVRGLDEIRSALGESRRTKLLGELFAEAWWVELVELVFRTGSETPGVRAGDTWSSERTEVQELYMTLSELVDFRVVTVTDERVEIESEGSYSVDMSKDAFASLEGGSVDDQTLTSRLVWDRRHGRLMELHEERMLQLSQTWQGVEMAKRYVLTRSVRRIAGSGE